MWNEQNLLPLPFSDLRQTLDKVSLQQQNGLIRLNGYLLHCVPMRCIYVNSVHHVTCEDDYSAGLVWPKDKIEHFIVSPRSLDGIRAVHQLHFFNRTGAFVTPYFFIHSFSTVLPSSVLPRPSEATVCFGSDLECVGNSAPYPACCFRQEAAVDDFGFRFCDTVMSLYNNSKATL